MCFARDTLTARHRTNLNKKIVGMNGNGMFCNKEMKTYKMTLETPGEFQGKRLDRASAQWLQVLNFVFFLSWLLSSSSKLALLSSHKQAQKNYQKSSSERVLFLSLF